MNKKKRVLVKFEKRKLILKSVKGCAILGKIGNENVRGELEGGS
jgi:hypothetical protein